jgi:hypothetical protein
MIEPYNGAIKGFVSVIALALFWFSYQKSDYKRAIKGECTLWCIFEFVQKPLGGKDPPLLECRSVLMPMKIQPMAAGIYIFTHLQRPN